MGPERLDRARTVESIAAVPAPGRPPWAGAVLISYPRGTESHSLLRTSRFQMLNPASVGAQVDKHFPGRIISPTRSGLL